MKYPRNDTETFSRQVVHNVNFAQQLIVNASLLHVHGLMITAAQGSGSVEAVLK